MEKQVRTPKKVLRAIKSRSRRVKKALSLSSHGKRMKGLVRRIRLDELNSEVKLFNHLQKNRLASAIQHYTNYYDSFDHIPVVIMEYMDRKALQHTSRQS